MKKNKRFAAVVCFILLLLSTMLFSVPASAATPKVEVSLKSNISSVRVGQTVILTVLLDVTGGGDLIYNIDDLKIGYNNSLFDLVSVAKIASVDISEGNPVIISYDRNGDACEDINDELATITLKAKSTAVLGAASFTITASSDSFLDKAGATIKFACNSPYTVTISDKMSDNCFLSNLIVNEGTLTPSFKKETTKYSVKVANSVSRINLQYDTEDDIAKVTVTNASSIKVGSNTVKVTVTAEDGTTKDYILTVTRAAEAAATDSSAISSSADSGMTADQYTKKLQQIQNRNLIIILILVFAVLAELAYILIEKFSKKKQPAIVEENSSGILPDKETSGENKDEDIGEPQSIIDSILNNTDDDNTNK